MVAAAEQRSLLAVSRIGVPAVLLAMPVTLQQHSVQLIVLVLSVCDPQRFCTGSFGEPHEGVYMVLHSGPEDVQTQLIN